MSAEVLREAASLLRWRAEEATPGPWITDRRMVVADPGPLAKYVADCFDEPIASDADAAYIALVHPAVGLAVADWLDESCGLVDAIADFREGFIKPPEGVVRLADHALAVARIFLGADR